MSEQRIVVETLCKHGAMEPHNWFTPKARLVRKCPGGSRRIVELPDMEKLREAVDSVSDIKLYPSDPLDPILAAARWVLSLESE